jgi:hypothetical protein
VRPTAALLAGAALVGAACDPSLPPPNISGPPDPCLPAWAASDRLGVTSSGSRRPCQVGARREGCLLTLTLDACEPGLRPVLTLDFDPAREGAPIVTRDGGPCTALPRGPDDLRASCGDTRYALADRAGPATMRVADARVLVPGAELQLPFTEPNNPTIALNGSSIGLTGGWLGGSAALDGRVWVAARDRYVVRCEREGRSRLVAVDAATLETRAEIEMPGCTSRVAATRAPAAVFAGFVVDGRHFVARVDPALAAVTASVALPFAHAEQWDMIDLAVSEDGDLYVAMGRTPEAQEERRAAYLWFDGRDLTRRALVSVDEPEEVRAVVGRGGRLRATRRGAIALVDVDLARGRIVRDDIGFALEAGRPLLVERAGTDLLVGLVEGGVTYPTQDGVAWSFTPTALSGGMTLSGAAAYVGFSGPFVRAAPRDTALPARLARVTLDPLHVEAPEVRIGDGLVGEVHAVAPGVLVATLPWTGAVVRVEVPRD